MKTMERKQFLSLVGTSIGAIILQQCLSGCKNSKEDDPSTPTPENEVTIDLTQSKYAALATNGGYVYENGIIVARTSAGEYIAVSQFCTHQGTSVQYRLATNDLYCPNHGATYTTGGVVTQGPATASLTRYTTTLTGTTLVISA